MQCHLVKIFLVVKVLLFQASEHIVLENIKAHCDSFVLHFADKTAHIRCYLDATLIQFNLRIPLEQSLVVIVTFNWWGPIKYTVRGWTHPWLRKPLKAPHCNNPCWSPHTHLQSHQPPREETPLLGCLRSRNCLPPLAHRPSGQWRRTSGELEVPLTTVILFIYVFLKLNNLPTPKGLRVAYKT